MPNVDTAGANMGGSERQPRRSFAPREFLALLFWASPTAFDVFLLLTGTLFAVAGGTTYPILGTLYGKLIDDLNSGSCDSDNGSPYEAVRAKVLLVAAVAVAQFVIIYIYMGCWTLFGERLVRRLRSRYLAALLTQDLAYFEQVPPGDISSRLDSDIQAIQDGTSEKVAVVLTSVSYFVTAYAISFNLNPKLAGLMSTMIPAYIIVGTVCSHLLTKYGQEVSKLTDRATSIAAEGLSNIKLVQAYRAQHRLEAIYAGYLQQMQAAATAQATIEALQMGLLYFVSYAANALAIWWGSRDIARSLASSMSGTTIGSVYTVIFVLVDASFVITRIAPHFKIFAGAVAASRNLSAVMERKSPLDTVPVGQGPVLRTVDSAIEFRDLSFRYPSRPKQLVLDNVSLSFPAKKMTAIVGLSGSGKSTVASLIPRLYEFENGEITIDDTDIRDMNLQHLRSLVAVVEQSTSLLQGSILENVAAGLLSSPKHSHLHQGILDGRLSALVGAVRAGEDLKHAAAVDSEVQEVVYRVQDAVELAEASAFVNRLHHGLASDAGHNGRQLSGGQVQRLGIARALIKDAPIMILDEATASLDSMTERDIQSTIEKRCSGKTIICIAHRLSTIRNADKVIVMGAGKVLEEGSYAELLDRDGHFARMISQQDMGGHSRASTVMSSSSLPLVAANLDKALAHDVEPPTIHHNEQQIVDYPLETTPLLGSTIPPSSAPKVEASSLVQLFPKVMALAKSQRLFLVVGALSAVLAGVSAPINAVVFGNMVGSMSPCNGWRQVLSSGQFYGVAFLVLAVYDTVTTTARGAALGRFSQRVLLSSRILTFRSLFYQNVQWHEDSGRNPNTLLSYLTNDASSLGAMSGSLIGVCLSIIVNLGLGIILSHVIAWKIAVVLLGAVPLLLASGFLRIRMMAHFTEKHREAFAHSVGVAKDAIDHIPTVALYSLETYAERTYLRALQEPYDQTLGLIVVGNFWLALSFGLGSLVYAFAYWWGAYQVEQGAYSSTQLFIVLPALLVSAQQSGQLFTLAPDISRAGVAAKQIFKQLDIGPPGNKISEPSEIGQESDPESALSPERSQRPKNAHGLALEFREVSFCYPSRKKQHVLRDLNLYIPADTLCAFTGPSGAGKSTLFSLMLDHYQPTEGQVLLDGRSLQTLPASFRDDIAIVPQESVLFNASIEFNITVGLPPGATASRNEIEEVCRLANIHGVISKLPDGYDTIVGGTGSGLLSGGQKQRIALARALIRKPRMLLLDEATSALDTESERIWRESLEALMNKQQQGGGMRWGRMTVVAIAHRLSTVRRAARIFWIEGGSCEFFGTHEELYSNCIGYRNAVDGQGFAAE